MYSAYNYHENVDEAEYYGSYVDAYGTEKLAELREKSKKEYEQMLISSTATSVVKLTPYDIMLMGYNLRK